MVGISLDMCVKIYFCRPLWARGISPALACEIELKPEHYHIARWGAMGVFLQQG